MVPFKLTYNVFGGTIPPMSEESEGIGSIVGGQMPGSFYPDAGESEDSNIIEGNYYLSGTLGGIDNADTDGAKLGMQDNADNTMFIELLAGADKILGSNSPHNFTLNGRKLYKDGSWNTLCLPFNLSSFDNTPLAGATVKELTNATVAETTTLTFATATSIEAGKPYLVKWETTGDPIENPTFTGVTLKDFPKDHVSECDTIVSKADGKVQFIGNWSAKPITADDSDIWYMTAANTLKHTGVSRTLHACRAYFVFDETATAREFHLDFGDDATGIGELKNENRGTRNEEGGTRNDVVYDLSGRKVSGSTATLKKGVYILNGRTVVVK